MLQIQQMTIFSCFQPVTYLETLLRIIKRCTGFVFVWEKKKNTVIIGRFVSKQSNYSRTVDDLEIMPKHNLANNMCGGKVSFTLIHDSSAIILFLYDESEIGYCKTDDCLACVC